ncbi:U-box domain-containing protein 21-like [Cucurbita pepo subsp. pepo]|uniref:U-box domain-containing protein 21-like n=1 Tax=Cucurbita pepo subsp. pepo TaxID=3664 RepID=UPI000C9D938C|nr:U-box domain-containing protein 21-like [Cucurbita pepo subsp. pepo]
MMFSWRRRRATRRMARGGGGGGGSMAELTIPSHFLCPISLDLMKDPVTMSTGITYDRANIETWIEGGNFSCPFTNQPLHTIDSIPNHNIRKMIQAWCVENRAHGIERIPTPKVPASPVQVREILDKIAAAVGREDCEGCKSLVEKIKILVQESERNKKCIIANGTGNVLSSAFEAFSKPERFEKRVEILEEILWTMAMIFPLQEEAIKHLKSEASMQALVWFVRGEDKSRRRSSILVLKEIISSYPEKVSELGEIQGVLEGLMKLIKEPICSSSKKASLFITYHAIASSSNQEGFTKAFLQMGLVPLLLETLVDAERSVCERALGVFDGICETKRGREEAYAHALTMPVIVKKILRVSDLATELSVSIVWKLVKHESREGEDEDGGVKVEALQVGAFQKLLLLLQVGCSEWTKEKATELLKLLNNLHRERLECIDSLDFKDLKRTF